VRDQPQELEKEGHITIEKFNNYAEDFYDICTEYIQEWRLPFLTPLQPMDWINLKGKVTRKSVQVNYIFMKTVVPDLSLKEDNLFDEISCVQKYCESKSEVWNEKNDQNITEKWCEMLAHFTKESINTVNIKYLINFCLALLGPNAPIEHVFSIINVLRSDEKNRLSVSLNHCECPLQRFLLFKVLPKYQKKKCFWNRFTNLISVQVNLGRLSQSKTFILFLYEFY
jgi:hypothetical protein